MSRLKRREPFGKAGLTVAILALVFAVAGGAWAAAGLNGKQKTEVKKIAKQFAGKAGSAGPQGPAGLSGPAGAKGDTGSTGSPGANGTFSSGPLPSGQTLTGVWAASGPDGHPLAQISFPIKVTPAPTTLIQFEPGANYGLIAEDSGAHLYPFIPSTPEEIEEVEEAWEEACPGAASAPTAAPGFLCVYLDSVGGTSGPLIANTLSDVASQSGVLIPMQLSGSGDLYVKGSWAVTAQ